MNRPELLQDALSSLTAQTYEHWEAVVVNDAGDDVSEIVAAMDPGGRIRCVSHDRNSGLAAARNTGIRLSSGEIICYLDDDDMFYPHHLETVVAALREAGRECVYTDTKFVQEELDNGARIAVGEDRRNADLDYSLERLHVTNHIPVNAWAHRRSLLGRTGLFDESMKALEDWDLLLRIARTTDIRRLGTLTTEVRERSEGRLGQQMRHEFPALYRLVYGRYDDLGSPAVAAGREQMLTDDAKGSENKEAARPEAEGSEYTAWCEQHCLTEADAQLMAERMMRDWKHCPAVHLIAVLQPGQEARLVETIADLNCQLYRGWGLTIFAATPCPEPSLQQVDNIEWIEASGDVTAQVNRAIRDTGADWVALVEAGDRLEPHLLFTCVDHAHRHPAWQFIYVDEDIVDGRGQRADPHFKPDFNLDLLRSMPYVGSFCLVNRKALERAGGWVERGGLENYDAAFRILETWGEEAIGHAAEMLYHRRDVNREALLAPQVQEAGRAAVADHLARCASACAGLHGPAAGHLFRGLPARGAAEGLHHHPHAGPGAPAAGLRGEPVGQDQVPEL